MATLQKLRNKGSLLIAFIGIALLAFVAGDIVKLFQKTPKEEIVGTINGEEITVSEFYAFRNQCEQAYKLFNSTTGLNENSQEEITQLAWSTLVNYKTLQAQAADAGVTVTPEEVSYIISTNWRGIAQQYTGNLPQEFSTQTGAFNIELINYICDEYSKAEESGSMPEELANMYDAWKFIETSITSEIISNKLMSIYALSSEVTNHAVAQNNFNLNNNEYSVEIAAYPYNNLPASQVTVSDEDVEEFYDNNKESYFKNPYDTYNVYYINHEIRPTSKDINNVRAEFKGYATSLKEEDADYNEIALYSSSETPYDGFLWTIDAVTVNYETMTYENKFKEHHKFHVQQNNVGEVAAPYEERSNNTFNLVMNVRKAMVPDSIKLRAIAIQSASVEELNATADSLLKALNNGVDFNKIAENYNSDTIELKTKNFINYAGLMTTPEAQEKIYTARVNAYDVIDMNANAKLIFQVMEKKGEVEAYDALIIEQNIPISAETYNQEYNKLSQLVASSGNLEELQKNILSTPYRLLPAQPLNANSANIANKPGTRELLRWVLNSGSTGDISDIHEYVFDNKKYMMVAAISEIIPEGYRELDDMLKEEIKQILINEKKSEIIAAQLKDKKFEELASNENIKLCQASQVQYKKPTSISSDDNSFNADEMVIGAAVANMQVGEVSAPIKGDNAVYVVKVLAKQPKNNTFNALEESYYIQSLDFNYNPNIINMLIHNVISENYSVDNKVYEHI